jgi:hypothetical protein
MTMRTKLAVLIAAAVLVMATLIAVDLGQAS